MKHIVFYDAQCPFCYHVKLVLKKLDWRNRIEWTPVQEVEQNPDAYPYLQNRNVYEEIHMLTNSGNLYAGFYSIRRLLTSLPLTLPISLILYMPLVDQIGSPLYKWFSRRRYEWFGRYDQPRYN